MFRKPAPPPVFDPEKIVELNKEVLLPDSRVMPMQCSRASREMLTYNRHDLAPPSTLTRLRERDCLVIGDQRITLSVSILDYGFCGAVFVTMVNNTENRERSMTKLLPFTMGSIGLPVSASSGDLMYRSEDSTIDILRSNDKWYVRMQIDRFDDVRSLYVNAIVEDTGSESAFSAVPVGRKNDHFLLRHGLYGMPVSGKIVLGAEVYELQADCTVSWLERERSDGGNVPEHSRITLSGSCSGIPFGLCASEGGVFPTENALVFDGRTYRPEGMTLRHEEGAWEVFTPDGSIQLYLPVTASRTDRIKLFSLSAERQREYGLCLGELNLSGQRYVVSSGIGCGEHTICKC